MSERTATKPAKNIRLVNEGGSELLGSPELDQDRRRRVVEELEEFAFKAILEKG